MHARTHLPKDLTGTEVRLLDLSFFFTIAVVGSGEGGKSEVFRSSSDRIMGHDIEPAIISGPIERNGYKLN